MSVQSEVANDLDKVKVVKFKQTPVMSTYLVAFVVGEFEFIEAKSGDGVKVRVYTPLGKKEQGRFALEMSGKALDYYREYFDIAYPLDKMDLIAISDFAAGAMENWVRSCEKVMLLLEITQTLIIGFGHLPRDMSFSGSSQHIHRS